MVEHVHQVTEVHSDHEPVTSSAAFLARIIYFVFGVIIAFLAMRMVLLILGANQGNAIVDLVYGISGVFVAPFYGMFGYTPTFGAAVFDISSLTAIVVYALISWGLVSLITLGMRDRTEV
ncbi:MAG: Membrane protein involved in colicin uptake [Candidatus Saccharibacteria bacterium]|nr:Membrane protein involved in colicin uptake [Candidatus Saccharibacteria bacterium]